MTAAPSPDQTGGRPGAALTAADLTPGRPIVFRNATVLTMDDAHHVLDGGDILITGDRITAVGPGLQVPEGTAEIDATGGILMPGMIDTHRHMWQTAMRGYGADWTLTQYFVWNYLQWGKTFRPQDVYAGNLLSAIEAIDAGVTTTVAGHTACRPPTMRTPRWTRWRRYRAFRPRLRHPAGPVGAVGDAGVPRFRQPALRRRQRHARLPDGFRHPRTPSSSSAPRSRWPATWACR